MKVSQESIIGQLIRDHLENGSVKDSKATMHENCSKRSSKAIDEEMNTSVNEHDENTQSNDALSKKVADNSYEPS